MPSIAAVVLIAVAGSAGLQAAPEGTPLKFHSITLSFLALFGIGLVMWIVWTVFLYPYFFSPLTSLPQAPGGSLILGQFNNLNNTEPGSLHTKWANTIRNKGLIRYLTQFNEERVMPTSPQALQELLVQKAYRFTKAAGRAEGTRYVIGHGLLTVTQPSEHKIQRKNLQPAFAFGYIKELFPLFWSKSTEMVAKMQTEVLGDKPKQWHTINIGDWANRAALDVIGIAGIGQDFGAIEDPNSELPVAWALLSEPSDRAIKYYIWGRLLGLTIMTWLPIERNKELKYGGETLKKYLLGTIQKKRTAIAEKRDDSVDIASRIIQNAPGYSDQELIEHMMNLLGAGHDTTSTSCQWAVFFLCKHPEMQVRLRKELREKLPKPLDSIQDPEALTHQNFADCHYLNAVVSEVLRFRPSLDTAGRDAAEPVDLAGHSIPIGARVQISITGINRSKELWGEDAATFNPDRWLDKDESTGDVRANKMGGASSNYAFSTFLHGARSCIGKDFARGELLGLVAALITSFEFRLQDINFEPTVTSVGITTKPKGGIEVDMRLAE